MKWLICFLLYINEFWVFSHFILYISKLSWSLYWFTTWQAFWLSQIMLCRLPQCRFGITISCHKERTVLQRLYFDLRVFIIYIYIYSTILMKNSDQVDRKEACLLERAGKDFSVNLWSPGGLGISPSCFSYFDSDNSPLLHICPKQKQQFGDN